MARLGFLVDPRGTEWPAHLFFLWVVPVQKELHPKNPRSRLPTWSQRRREFFWGRHARFPAKCLFLCHESISHLALRMTCTRLSTFQPTLKFRKAWSHEDPMFRLSESWWENLPLLFSSCHWGAWAFVFKSSAQELDYIMWESSWKKSCLKQSSCHS